MIEYRRDCVNLDITPILCIGFFPPWMVLSIVFLKSQSLQAWFLKQSLGTCMYLDFVCTYLKPMRIWQRWFTSIIINNNKKYSSRVGTLMDYFQLTIQKLYYMDHYIMILAFIKANTLKIHYEQRLIFYHFLNIAIIALSNLPRVVLTGSTT